MLAATSIHSPPPQSRAITFGRGHDCSLPHHHLQVGCFRLGPVIICRGREHPTAGGGWLEKGVAANTALVVTPLPVPPPQGGREPCGAASRTNYVCDVRAPSLYVS